MNEMTEYKVLDMQSEEEYTDTVNGIRESIADMWEGDDDMVHEAYTTKSAHRLAEMMEGLGYLIHQIKD